MNPTSHLPHRRRGASALSLAAFLLLCGSARELPAQEPHPPATSTSGRPTTGFLAGAELRAETIRQLGPGELVLEGAVTISSERARMQADRLTIREERYIEAEGNVLIVWAGNRISGTRMTYDLKEDHGVIENAIGQVEPEFYFTADRAEKVGQDRIFLDSATVTTCTQPVPYWSFSVSSAKVRVDHYARMWNLRLRALHMPVFYLPYMVWPVKRDRAAGLLLPKFGTTRDRGDVITEAFFLPLGDSADVTLFGEYYTKAGWGGGGEFSIIPNRDGAADVSGFFIQDQVAGFDRYRITYKQTQKFVNGFRMIADVNEVSDFAYFTDFERELRLASSPSILARIEFTRNGNWTSINVRELRREQLFFDGTSLIQQTLPQLELRGRSRRLSDHSPFYLSFESSLASIQQRGATIDADYVRADIFPTISAPLSPAPWLDITPSVSYRLTRYTQQREGLTGPTVDEDLTRGVAGGSFEITGPKFSRIFERPDDAFSPRYKHLIEPRIVYSYGETFARKDDVILYDQVDLTTASNLVTYGLRSRLFARRPQAKPAPPKGEGEKILLPGDTGEEMKEAPQQDEKATTPSPAEPEGPPPPREPVEIASFEIVQSHSFVGDLSSADLDRDGVLETTSPRSNIQLTGRFNPSPSTSVDLSSQYNNLYSRFSNVSLSGNLRNDSSRIGFSLVHTAGLGVSSFFDSTTGLTTLADVPDTTQLRLNTGLTLFGGKLRLDLDGSYNPTATGLEKKVPDQLWRVQYYTQCCGFLAEYLARDFTGYSRREFRFSLDLRGIGKLLDLHDGENR